MRAIEIGEAFGLDGLRLVERPDPEPGPGQIRVRMAAASLNYRDLLMVEGRYNPRQPLPLVPCSDGVGRVDAVGPGVERVGEGDRVATIFAQGWLGGPLDRAAARTTLGGPLPGVLADRVVLSAEGVVPVPEHLTDVEAACLPCAGVTAWNALGHGGGLRPGDTVVLQGTGGVSILALQLARLAGARVLITSSSAEKLARARELGAEVGVRYDEQPDWSRAVRDWTGKRGADLVVEVGGAGTLQQSIDSVAFDGRIALIGVLAGNRSELDITRLFMQRVRVQGIFVGSRADFEALHRAVAAARLRPVVDRVVPLERTREALEALKSGAHFGKIAIGFDA